MTGDWDIVTSVTLPNSTHLPTQISHLPAFRDFDDLSLPVGCFPALDCSKSVPASAVTGRCIVRYHTWSFDVSFTQL